VIVVPKKLKLPVTARFVDVAPVKVAFLINEVSEKGSNQKGEVDVDEPYKDVIICVYGNCNKRVLYVVVENVPPPEPPEHVPD
jgi:hypothetical protein